MAFGEAPDEIVREIKRLHSRGEPLNIAAIKRKHPNLLRRVYAIHPFLGWRKAIEAAGVDYSEIEVELLDRATCKICGEEFGILATHIKQRHGTAGDDYLKDYPEADLMAETIRAARSFRRGKSKPKSGVRHWESLWSAEYVLDRIAELHRHELPLNFMWATEHERALACAALKYFGRWDEALRRVGLDPAQIRRQSLSEHLSGEQVIKRLRTRRRLELPLNDGALIKQDLRLYNASRRRFGSYSAALRATGIDPKSVRLRPWKHDQRDVRQMLTAVREAARLPDDKWRKAWPRLRARYNPVATSRRFGSWTKVFEAAGFDRQKLIRKRYPDKTSVLAALRERLKKHLPIKAGVVFREERTLYNAALKHFGGFAPIYPLLNAERPPRARRMVSKS